MHFYSNMFAELAARARGGDRQARDQFRREMERALTHMVRQTLRTGAARSPMAERILAVAGQVMPLDDFAWVENRAELERAVVETVCAEMVERLRPTPNRAPALRDSVADLNHAGTVLAC